MALAVGAAPVGARELLTQPLVLGDTYVFAGSARNWNRPVVTRWRLELTPLCQGACWDPARDCNEHVCVDDPRVASAASCGRIKPGGLYAGACYSATITCRGAACPCRRVTVDTHLSQSYQWTCGGQHCSAYMSMSFNPPFRTDGYVYCDRDETEAVTINAPFHIRYRRTR